MANEPNATHGAPSWIQHSGGDPTAARKFYETVLDWTISELPMKDGSTYAAIAVAGKPVGGFSPIPGEGGWLPFVTVDDVDKRLAKAKRAGAVVASDASTVPGVGRLAIIADPFGAQLALIDYTKA